MVLGAVLCGCVLMLEFEGSGIVSCRCTLPIVACSSFGRYGVEEKAALLILNE